MVHEKAPKTSSTDKANPRQLADEGIALATRYRSTLSPKKLDDAMGRFADENAEMLIGLEAQVNHLQSQLFEATREIKEIHSTLEIV